MKNKLSALQAFKRFLNAEEVPRWFGLSLVLIYLVGLGSVARYGIGQARREGAEHFHRSVRYSVRALADRLSEMVRPADSDSTLVAAHQRALRDYAVEIPTRYVRIVDGSGRVLASTDATEVGVTIPAVTGTTLLVGEMEFTGLPVENLRSPDVLVRVRLASLQPAVVHESVVPRPADSVAVVVAEPVHFLEVRFPPVDSAVSSLADQARMLATVLVVLGALFVVYRCLREQLRSASRIADRLANHRDRLGEQITSLRIADTADGVASTWNELIDLTQELQTTVERSEANEELSDVLRRSSGGALAEALHAVPEGLIYVTDEVRFEYVNSAALHLFDWTEEEVGQMSLPEAKAKTRGIGDEVLNLLREALQSDGSFESRTEILTMDDGSKGGDNGAYRVQILPLRRSLGRGECMVIVRDVSQQLRAERAREEFLTQVTHELRTPLTNIRAYAETLSSGMFDDPKVITECYNVITKETRRLGRLVEDILSVSQLEVGAVELQMGDVDIKTLLTEGVRDVRGLADEANIDLQVTLPTKLEPIRGDRDKLAVVVNNLLGNAIKYTPANGNIEVGCQVSAEEVVFTVKDNGIGINPEDHTRIFEKFQRVCDPEVQKEAGTGIGLYTAREIVRHHRGEIDLISEKGKGATFLVRLPQTESRASSLTAGQES